MKVEKIATTKKSGNKVLMLLKVHPINLFEKQI